MQQDRTNLILRDDTVLGVCQALGEDFNFNPVWLRVALGVSLLWNPTAVLGAYGALAVLVLLSRLVFPNPKAAPAESAASAPAADEAAGREEAEASPAQPMPIAA